MRGHREVAYVTAGRLLEDYEQFCLEHRWPFEHHLTVHSPDPSTLFCIAGMQRYKTLFRDENHRGTICGVQRCLRLDDLEQIDDGRHWLSFDMLGMFSFRTLGVGETVELWWRWLDRVGIRPDVVTVHPDRSEWSELHRPHGPRIEFDEGCTWSDGSKSGAVDYCTEFYVDGLEIGNIVNPRGDCIDVGFGLDRLGVVSGDRPPSGEDLLREAVERVIGSGVLPGNKRQGYVLRRLLREMTLRGISLDHPVYQQEIERQHRLRERYERLLEHHQDESPQWWWETHGIDVQIAGLRSVAPHLLR